MEEGNGKPRRTSENCPIVVDFLPEEVLPLAGRLGLTLAPGKKAPSEFGPPWDRGLGVDLKRLREVYGAKTLVCLLEDREMEDLKIPDLVPRAEDLGIRVLRCPVQDGAVPAGPDLPLYGEVISEALSAVGMGETVVVHCRGGLGRAGTFAACCLVKATGAPAKKAIHAVRKTRRGAIENEMQERFVDAFGRSGFKDS
jgi:protein-tyrosine phosphatase